MKVKTSITLSDDILKTVDKYSGSYKNRPQCIEVALRAFVAQLDREERDARDLEILNRRAGHLNEEAAGVLSFQVEI